MAQRLEALLSAGTAVLSDIFDRMGRVPVVLDTALRPVKDGRERFVGPAYTVAGESHRWTEGGDRAKLAAIDGMPSGVVSVWAGNDIRGVCCFGDLLASAMQVRGCAGAVVDGGVRDVAYLRQCSMPVVSRYRTPAQAIGRWRVSASQVPVQLRGALEDKVTVYPGDIMVGDEDGVIVVPQALLGVVLDKVVESTHIESGARDEIQRGLPLIAALDKYGHL